MPHVPDTVPGKRVTDAGARTEGRGQPSNIRGGSRMQESCTYGSVRGAPSNGCPYRNRQIGNRFEASPETGPIEHRAVVSSEHLPALGKVIDLLGISHWATSRPAMQRLRTAFSKRASHPMCTVATAPGSLSVRASTAIFR